MEKSKTKKIVTITLDVLFALFMVCIIMFAISNINAKKNNKIPNLFGNGYMTVVSDSMDGKHEDSFKVGDLITVKLANKDGSNMENLQINQMITYYGDDNKIITHRIFNVVKDNGYTLYYTIGDKAIDDANIDLNSKEYSINELRPYGAAVVASRNVLAVYTGKVKGLGTIITYFQSPIGFFIIVVLPTILFFVYELIKFIKTYNETKNEEKNEKTEEERLKEKEELRAQILAEIEAEKKKSQEGNN